MRELQPSAHVDSFTRDHLPPHDQWPEINRTALPDLLAYPQSMNAATELLDSWIESGHGDRPCCVFEGRTWTYAHLAKTANRIANVLADELSVEPGE